MRRLAVLLVLAALVLALLPGALAQEADGRYQDFGDVGGFWNIVPPGQKGVFNSAEALAAQGGQFPEHSNDQTPMYDGLLDEAGLGDLLGVSDGDIGRFFKDGAFGTEHPADAYSPTEGLTIVRDGEFGVPHIFGETRDAAMFGAGYAGAEDRLFLMDVLRHLGRGRLSEMLGASEGNRQMDQEQLRVAPYTEEELSAQVQALCDAGAEGAAICTDADAYTAGVNAFMAEARQNPSRLPAEYAALQIMPEDWVNEDIVAIASLVGGIFGRGGGGEIANGRFLAQLQAEHGAAEGATIFADFRSANDPEAPHTVEQPFAYNNHTAIDPASTAILDLETVDATIAAMAPPSMIADGPFGQIDLRALADPMGMSNAILATGAVTDGGVPIAVFGPQTGYFTPQLLVEMGIYAPGIAARGTAFAGTNLFIQLGRGTNYAWSATSAGGDNVDQWVLELCEPDDSDPSEDSQHYVYDGECREMDVFTQSYFAKPTAGGFPPTFDDNPILVEDTIERSDIYGPIVARGTIDGAPVAVAVQRSTYGAELASAFGFRRINDPQYMARGAEAFMDAFDGVEYTFNWFYVDEDDIAYKHSCKCPIRHPGSDPDLPTWGTGEWDWTGQWLAPAQQPQAVNPASGFFANWNNKQAPQFRANDSTHSYSSTYRSEFLRKRMTEAITAGRKLTRGDMVNIAMDAATVDLNGQEIYPLLLDVLGEPWPAVPSSELAARLREWVDAGGHRRDTTGDGQYDHAVAVAIGDALLRPLLDEVIGPVLGDADWPQRIEDHPNQHLGSAYNGGRANFLHKDFRQVLGHDVAGARSRTYCGGGDRATCTQAIWSAMATTHDALVEEYGSDDPDDWVYDASQDDIVQSAVGVVQSPNMRWQNRPTFQQVVQSGSRIGRVAGAERVRTATAVSRLAFGDGADTVVLASAADFPDALAGTPLAVAENAPLLLSARERLSPAAAREIARLGAANVLVLGGTAALSAQVDDDLAELGVTSRRIAGANRFATAALIAAELDDVTSIVIANGDRFPDALAAGPYAGVSGRAILLTRAGSLPEETREALGGLSDAVIAGGSAAVSGTVTAALRAEGLELRRIAGPDRYGTAVAFAEAGLDEGLDVADLFAVTGANFPDALAAGATAAAVGGTLVLLNPLRLGAAPDPAAFLAEHDAGIARLWLVGGQAVLSSALRAELE